MLLLLTEGKEKVVALSSSGDLGNDTLHTATLTATTATANTTAMDIVVLVVTLEVVLDAANSDTSSGSVVKDSAQT